jgi:hypothetical protein
LCTWKNIKVQGRQVSFVAHKRITIGRVSFETYFTEQIQMILESFEIRTSKLAEKFGLFQHNLKSTGITIKIRNHQSIKQITNSEILISKFLNSRFSSYPAYLDVFIILKYLYNLLFFERGKFLSTSRQFYVRQDKNVKYVINMFSHKCQTHYRTSVIDIVRLWFANCKGLLNIDGATGRREKRCGGKDRTKTSVVYSIIVSYIYCTIAKEIKMKAALMHITDCPTCQYLHPSIYFYIINKHNYTRIVSAVLVSECSSSFHMYEHLHIDKSFVWVSRLSTENCIASLDRSTDNFLVNYKLDISMSLSS